MKTWPNPIRTGNLLRLSGATVDFEYVYLYDVKGSFVEKMKIADNGTCKIDALPGIYVIVPDTNESMATKLLIVP